MAAAEIPDLDGLLVGLEGVLQSLLARALTPEQAHLVLYEAMPKLVLMLLKLRCSDVEMHRLNEFFKHVLRATVDLLRTTEIWELVECATRVLTDGAAYNLYNRPVAGGSHSPGGGNLDELDSNSSGEGSGSDGSLDAEGTPHDVGNPGILSSNVDDVSPYYVQNIELFHSLGGFHACLERILREPCLNLSGVKGLLRPFIKVKDLLSRHALQAFARTAQQALMSHLATLTDEQLKQEGRKSMTEVVKSLEVFLHAAKLPDANRLIDDFSLALALKCMRSQNLEKRLYGLNEIKDTINISMRKFDYYEQLREREANGTAPAGAPVPPPSSWTTPDVLVAWVQREQLVDLIFGEGLHDQIVRRCPDVLRFLALRDAFDSRLLDFVWRASLDKHESVKQAIYFALVEITVSLPLALLDALYSHIRSVPHAEYTQQTVTLLRGFSVCALQSPCNAPKSRRWYGLEEFWQLMQSSQVSHDLRMHCLGVLGEMLTWQHCAAQRAIFLERCVGQLRTGEAVPQALRLCQRIAAAFPGKPRKKNDQHNLSTVLEWLDNSHELLRVFFLDFQRYHAAASQRLDILAAACTAASSAAAAAASSSADGAGSSGVTGSSGGGAGSSSSGGGSAAAAAAASATLGKARAEHMMQVQERLEFLSFCTTNSGLVLTPSQLDLLWDCCVQRASGPQEADKLFTWIESVRIKSETAFDLETTKALFTRASALPLGALTPTGYSCIEFLFKWVNWKNGHFVQNQVDFSVLGLPLFGAPTLWEVALRSADALVGKRSVGLLTQLHHSLPNDQPQAQAQQRRAFVAGCMRSLAAAADEWRALQQGAAAAPAAPDQEQLPDAPLEEGGASEPASEQALSLRVERCLTLLRLFVEEVEAKLPADETLGGRARRHGAAVRGVPMRILVTVVGGSNTPKLEVQIDSNQTVAALRSRVWRELSTHGEWQPETPHMLRMITQGKELKEDHRTLADLRLREPYGIHVMRRTSTSPQKGAADADADAIAPKAAAAAGGGGGEGCSAAGAMGAVAAEDADGAAPMEATSAEVGGGESGGGKASGSSLPGQVLSNEGSHFATLFELLTLQDERLALQAWQLLMMLPTNRAMRSGLAALPALRAHTPPDWPSLLHTGSSSFKLLYSLQTVDSLMFGSAESSSEAGPDGLTWASAFVAHGGVRQLLDLLLPPEGTADLLDASRGSQRKPCLVLLLKLLCQFLLASPTTVAEALPITPAEPPELAAIPLAAAAPAEEHGTANNAGVAAALSGGGADAAPSATLTTLAGAASPVWARRTFSPLAAGEVSEPARSAAFATRLMSLLDRTATAKCEPPAAALEATVTLHLDLPAIEGSEAAVDVQISREALQLLVGSVASAAPALAVLCQEATLDGWLLATLLRCPNVEARLETCAALLALASGENVVSSDADATLATMRTTRLAVLGSLLRLLPNVEAHNARSRQYFDLLHALIVSDLASGAAEPELPSVLCAPGRAQALCETLVGMLNAHGVHERRDRPEAVDQVLLGLLHGLRLLHPHLLLPARRQLMHDTFSDLFSLPSLADARSLGPTAPPKCKATETRVCGLALLSEMAESKVHADAERTELVELLLKLHDPRTGGAPPRTLWHYMPSAMERARCGFVGLKNLGATCYLNALMQQLYMIPEMRSGVVELPLPAEPPAPPADKASPNKAFLSQLQSMFSFLHESEKKFYDTRELCASWRDFESLPINPSIQMDVDEFYNNLFEVLEVALRDTPSRTLLPALFGGTLVNQIISKEGQMISERQEMFYTISIEVKCKKSILDGLASYVEGEVLDGDNKYKCESGEYVEAVKRVCVGRLPPVLFIHLKRFEFDFEAMKKVKLDDHFEFPPTINMRPYTVDGLAAAASQANQPAEGAVTTADEPPSTDASNGGEDEAPSADGAPFAKAGLSESATDQATALAAGQLYELVGVLVHSGTADSGHYYSYIKERRTTSTATGGSAGGQGGWLHFNDTLVEPFDERDIPKCCYGGVEPVMQWDAEMQKHVQRMAPKPHSAYMLLYERVQPPHTDEMATASLAAARPAATPAAASAAAVPAAEVAAEESLAHAAAASSAAPAAAAPTAEELNAARGTALLVRAAQPASVPPSIIMSAWSENMQFLRDRLIFDAAHFAFVRRVVAGALPPPAAAPEAAATDDAHVASGAAPPSAAADGAVSGTVGEASAEPASLASLSAGSDLTIRSLQLGCRFLVVNLAHAKDKSSLGAWLSLLQTGLARCLPACRWLLLEADAAGWLRQMLLVCTVAEMRNAFSSLLLHAMRCLRPAELSLYDVWQTPEGIDEPMQGVAIGGGSSSSSPSSSDEESSEKAGAAPRIARGREAEAATTAVGPPLPTDQPMEVEQADEHERERRTRPRGSGGASAPIGPQLRPQEARAPRREPAAAAVRTIDALLAMVHEASSHWRHFPQFFLVMLEFARLGAEEKELLLRRRVVTLLIDFYLGEESPLAADDGPNHRSKRTRMGDKFTLPNLEHMVELIATLVLSSTRTFTFAENDSRPPPETTPYSIAPLLTMHADDLNMATCAPFIAKMLKEGLNVRALEALLLHTCYEAQHQTIHVLQIVLQGIDTMDADALAPYLHIFSAIVCMADSLHQWRVNTAMGRLLRVIANNIRFKLATMACLRMLVTLAAHSAAPRAWLLHHHQHWASDWLLGTNSDGVRAVAETLIVTLLEWDASPLPSPTGSLEPGVAGPPLPPPPSAVVDDIDGIAIGPDSGAAANAAAPTNATEPAPAQSAYLDVVYNHLLSLLPWSADIAKDLAQNLRECDVPGNKALIQEMSSVRLSAYFRVLIWLARQGGTPNVSLTPLVACYDAQDTQHIDCDDAKRHMVAFWHAAALSPSQLANGPVHSSALAMAAQAGTFRRLLDSFVSLRPQERNILYNRELLPPFYGLMRAALEYELIDPATYECQQTLHGHRNWEWAIRYLLIESQDYADLLQLHVSRQPSHPDESLAPLTDGHSLSETLLKLLEPVTHYPQFRLKQIQNVLDDRTNLANGNVLALLDILIENGDDKQLACELRLLPRLAGIIELVHTRALASELGASGALRMTLKLIAKLADWLSKIDKRNPSLLSMRNRVMAAWGLAAEPARAMPLLGVCFSILAPALRMSTLPSPPEPQQEGLPAGEAEASAGMPADAAAAGPTLAYGGGIALLVPEVPSEATLQIVYDLTAALAQLDGRCAGLMLNQLGSHHDQPTSAELDTADDTHSRTLAGLSIERARALAQSARAAPGICRYHEYVGVLVYNSLTGHLNTATYVRASIHLALQLCAEAAPLPNSVVRPVKLLKQAATLAVASNEQQRDHPVAVTLRAELAVVVEQLRARVAPGAPPSALLDGRDIFTSALLVHQTALANPLYVSTLYHLLDMAGIVAAAAAAVHLDGEGGGADAAAAAIAAGGGATGGCQIPPEWVARAQAELATQRAAAAVAPSAAPVEGVSVLQLIQMAEALLTGLPDAITAAMPRGQPAEAPPPPPPTAA